MGDYLMTVTIDVGTTAVKVLYFDETDHLLKEVSQGYPTDYFGDGFAEQNPDTIVQAVFQSIKRLALAHKETIVLSTAMHSLMAVDKNFHKKTNLMIWADHRADGVIASFKKTPLAHTFFNKTKTPIHPMSPFAKLLWLKETKQGQALNEQLEDVYWIDIKTYLWYHLTGYNECDYSLGSATGLFNSETLLYDEDILSFLNINNHQLPVLVPVTHTRVVTDIVATQFSFFHTVVIGSSDGVLANISEGMHRSDVHVTIGTSGAIRMTVPRPYTDPEGRLFCYYLNDTHWVIGGAINNGGNVLKWLDDVLFDGTSSIYSFIDTLDFDAFDSTLVFIPHLNGERAPFWDTGRTGSFIGLKMSHKKEALVKAVIYGLLFNLRHVFDTLQSVTGDISEIYLSGGFFKVEKMKALMSQVFNVTIIESTTLEQTSKGALNLVSQTTSRTMTDYKKITKGPSKEIQDYYAYYLRCIEEKSTHHS